MMETEKRFQEGDISFFLELAVTLVMIMLVWSLLGGCSYAKHDEHPTVSLATAQVADASNAQAKQETPVPKESKISRYKVRRGDTLYRIAQKTGASVDAIAMANGISDPSKLAVGQVLIIPK